jgi:amino acid transporter
MPMVIASYLLANVAYFFVLPLDAIKSTNTVAVLFGAKVFGTAGSLILSLIVSASCLGALNATAFTSGRLVYAAGKEGYLPSILGRVGVGNQAEQPSLSTLRTRSWLSKKLASLFGDSETGLFFTPVNALLFNALVAVVYIIIGDFSTLLTFYFLTVLGLIVLRVREPHLERPYKTWISTPIIFCCVSLFLLSRAVVAEPLQTLIVAAFVVVGIPIYYWRIRGRDQVSRRQGENGEGPWWKFWKR